MIIVSLIALLAGVASGNSSVSDMDLLQRGYKSRQSNDSKSEGRGYRPDRNEKSHTSDTWRYSELFRNALAGPPYPCFGVAVLHEGEWLGVHTHTKTRQKHCLKKGFANQRCEARLVFYLRPGPSITTPIAFIPAAATRAVHQSAALITADKKNHIPGWHRVGGGLWCAGGTHRTGQSTQVHVQWLLQERRSNRFSRSDL